MTDFPTLLYPSTSELPTPPYPYTYLKTEKGTPFKRSPPRIGHHRKYPHPPPPILCLWRVAISNNLEQRKKRKYSS